MPVDWLSDAGCEPVIPGATGNDEREPANPVKYCVCQRLLV